MMTPTPLHPTSLLAIAVPKGAQNFQIDYGHLIYDLDEDPPKQYSEPLLNGKYKFIGLVTKDTIDFDAEKYVECISRPLEIWKNYHIDTQYMEYAPKSAADSFRSLLSANECWFENPAHLLTHEEKAARLDMHGNEMQLGGFKENEMQWKQAQSKVHECWAIIEKV